VQKSAPFSRRALDVLAPLQLGAVNGKGEKQLEIRLGGIYALEQVAKDSPDDYHWPIMEVLTAYVREHARWSEELPDPHSQPRPKEDIQAILTVLGRRTRVYKDGEEQRLNLAKTDLRGAQLRGARLQGVILHDAHLERKTNLRNARLEGALLDRAHLGASTNLKGAHLEGAILTGAH
jgi:hypothetical protein